MTTPQKGWLKIRNITGGLAMFATEVLIVLGLAVAAWLLAALILFLL